jgi:uncharacterized protein
VKLPLHEPEHAALRRELAHWGALVSSALLHVEALRACSRYGVKYVERAEAALKGIALMPIDDPIVAVASKLQPASLRALDALHLATALDVGSDLGVVVTYDQRLAAAAVAHGLRVVAPV